jgi:hypothetical protein
LYLCQYLAYFDEKIYFITRSITCLSGRHGLLHLSGRKFGIKLHAILDYNWRNAFYNRTLGLFSKEKGEKQEKMITFTPAFRNRWQEKSGL